MSDIEQGWNQWFQPCFSTRGTPASPSRKKPEIIFRPHPCTQSIGHVVHHTPRGKRMRIHIQDCQTRKFLRGTDTWVAGMAGARNFGTSMDAFRHCIDQGFAGVNIVVEFGAARAPLIIPVDPERKPVERTAVASV
jgi:hypothetical protein